MPMDVGRKAPDFDALRADGQNVEPFRLSDHLGEGPLVLAFFPLAFTSVCTNEMCTFRNSMSQFNELEAQVYGISVDSPFALNAFIEEHALTFPLLSDFNREVSRKFDVLHEDLMGLRGVAKRSVFVLDGEGVVRYRWVSEDPGVLPDFDEIKEALRALQG